jgi:hypothetical protein
VAAQNPKPKRSAVPTRLDWHRDLDDSVIDESRLFRCCGALLVLQRDVDWSSPQRQMKLQLFTG